MKLLSEEYHCSEEELTDVLFNKILKITLWHPFLTNYKILSSIGIYIYNS